MTESSTRPFDRAIEFRLELDYPALYSLSGKSE